MALRKDQGQDILPKDRPKEKHSLQSKKLGFYDLLENIAFRHCDGVMEVPNPRNDGNLATVESKLVNARYCDKFAHVRWKDGQIFHVHVSGDVHRNYERRLMATLDSYKQRMQWLQKGSRELFGTIIEDQVTILIDTSSSMNSRLFLVKDKLYQLLQEQIKHKRKFNLIKFDSRVQAWRSRLVDCNDRNIDDAWQWIKGLVVGGSTNTLGALKLALSDPLCSAIYLLTDGRPDQPPLTILSQIHLQDPVPIHTISFNCSDESANEFLCKLSENSNGRFHFFSEHGDNNCGQKTFESEDRRLIREEMEKGVNDLERLTRLRNWCAQLDWYGSNKNKTKTDSTVPRPSSAPLTRRPKKPSRTAFSRGRSVKQKRIKNDVVKPESKENSSKDSSSENESLKSESIKSEEIASKSVSDDLSNKEEEPLNGSKEEESLNGSKGKEKDKKKIKKKKKKVTRNSTRNDAEQRNSISKFLGGSKTPTNTRGTTNDFGRSNGDTRQKSSVIPTQKGGQQPDRPQAKWLRNHKVLARNDIDGFYYSAILRMNINSRYADVAFCDFESQVVSLRYIIPNEGARPCPSLKVGDYVLVKTLTEGGLPCHVPGVVYVVPLRQSKATKFYTVIHYNGKRATSLRKDLVKISQSRYTFSFRYIKDCEITANKSPAVSVFSLEAKKQNKSKQNQKSNSSGGSSEEDEADKSEEDILKKYLPDKEKSARHGSSEDKDNSSLKAAEANVTNGDLEQIKQALSDTRESQLKGFDEQEKRFEDLQQQLKDAMDNQAMLQEELKKQYDELRNSSGAVVVSGADDVKDKQLEESRKKLQEQQENMINDFKEHQRLLEELLHQRSHAEEKPTSPRDNLEETKKKKKKKKKSSDGSTSSSNSSSDSSIGSADNSPVVRSPEQPEHVSTEQDGVSSNIQFHVASPGKEACLWTKGSHGLLISRVPLEEDPAVENRPVPTPVRSGDEVLARWSDDGWYYRGTVRELAGDNYFVEDSVGNMEEIFRQNIISDEDDAGNTIQINDAVVALHPSFTFSYAPGVVVGMEEDLLYKVRFYDGQEDLIPREEVYYLSQEKFSDDVNYIVRCEESLVGQAVVARYDVDGLFYLANIRERVGNGRQYVVQWPDGSAEVQSSAYIFGAHTKHHQLAMGDRVLALRNTARSLYEPGWITGVNGKKLSIKFSTGKRSGEVKPMQCFWLSNDYYDRIVDYIASHKRR